MYRKWGKRAFDMAFAFFALAFVTPLLAIISLLVLVSSPGPVLFTQERLGRHGRIFRAFKFRTMTHRLRIPAGEVWKNDPEVTRLGYYLRRFKLDELPQLFNVLKGEMSIVGPRPALPSQLKEYDENSRQRLLVRPGLSGLAQVNGNVYLSWPERWVYDAEYARSVSFRLDLRIMCRTVAVIIRGEDHYTHLPKLTT
ncbi:MAG: sugar transferase [Pyrinomonadaceae bacterium]